MFKRKTVIEVLEMHDIQLCDEVFLKVYKKFYRKKCNAKIKSICYKEICQLRYKNPNNWLHIIQKNVYLDTINSCWKMNPFKDAVIITTTNHCSFGISYQKIRIFTYTPCPSSDIISLPNFSALEATLEANSNLFHVYQYNKESNEASLVTQFEDLKNNTEIICVSKRFPYVVMKY